MNEQDKINKELLDEHFNDHPDNLKALDAVRTYQQKRMQHILSDRPLAKKKQYKLNKVSEKRAAKLKEQENQGSESEMDLFFESQRPHMTGKCLFCGAKTMKEDDGKFHFSLAHLLPKAIFKSVATHPDNIIELCFYNNSCHTNFDSGYISWEFLFDSKEWSIIREKLLQVLPCVAPEERKNKLYDRLEKLVYAEK